MSMRVPLPPLDEQRRIVDILNRAARIETLRRRAAERLQEFVPALFIKMFGDPGPNPMRWPQRRIGDVCEVQGGLQVSKKRSTHPMEVSYLRVANVLRDRLTLDDIKLIRLTEAELMRTRLLPGDLLVVEGHGNAAEIGRVGVWDGQIQTCVHQNHLIRARPERRWPVRKALRRSSDGHPFAAWNLCGSCSGRFLKPASDASLSSNGRKSGLKKGRKSTSLTVARYVPVEQP